MTTGALGAAGGAAVVNVHRGPVVVPPTFLAVTCQKYVVPAARVGVYVALPCPADASGGGYTAPNATS